MPSFDNHQVPRARSLQRTATKAEKLLWNCLRNSTLSEAKFRRQFPIGPYIADFCCYKEKLVIELDGDSHDFSEKYDAARTTYLNQQGFRVIRFADADVFNHIEGVVAVIERELKAKKQTPPPSP